MPALFFVSQIVQHRRLSQLITPNGLPVLYVLFGNFNIRSRNDGYVRSTVGIQALYEVAQDMYDPISWSQPCPGSMKPGDGPNHLQVQVLIQPMLASRGEVGS